MAQQSLFSMLMELRPVGFAESVVYEDDHVVAFMDKFPLTRGHTLVVPKLQVEKLHELPEDVAAALGAATAKVAARVVAATGSNDYNVLQNNGKVAGQEIPHVHFHIVPRSEGDGMAFVFPPKESRPSPLPDVVFDGDLASLRDGIRSGSK